VLSRRDLFQMFFASLFMLSMPGCTKPKNVVYRKNLMQKKATIYRSINGSPAENISQVMDLMGGIEHVFGHDDIVVIKPNIQWWNQGAPNIAALETFISMIMDRPGGFRGEVVIAENNHRGAKPWNNAGWSTSFERNSDLPGILNYNQLAEGLKKKYGDRFSVCHWIDINVGAKRIFSPADGVGYVLCDGTGGVPLLSASNGLANEKRRDVIMSYPIFETDKGTVVDLKNGIWSKGSYTGQPLKFINLAALNHHSFYCGPTSAIKNFLGVSDLSGGPDPAENGRLTDNYYNFHSFPFDKWSKGPVPGMLGLEIGTFLNTIRKPDLHITTAEWIGLSTRTEPPVAHTRTICASTDPVALDYHSAKYILYPNSHIRLHDPEYTKGPFHADLLKCAQIAGCIFDEHSVDIQSFDLSKMKLQKDSELAVIGKTVWGSDVKSIFKYLVTR
jgi:hypothetical protein